jgi:hypothetical protein
MNNTTAQVKITRETTPMGVRYVVCIDGDRIGSAPSRRDANALAEHYITATDKNEKE